MNAPDKTPSPKTSFAHRLWTVIDIIGVRLRFILLMVIVGVIAAKWETIMNYYDRWTRPAQVTAAAHADEIEYFCAMHPFVIRPVPGKCPICGMPLSKRTKTAHGSATAPTDPGVLAQVQLTPQKMQMGRIGTSPAAYRLLTRQIKAFGVVDYDETHRATITARTKGRLEKLLVNYVGQKVKKGEVLAEIHSPDLQLAEEELIAAVAAQKDQPTGEAHLAATSLVAAARQKLWHWGLTEPQIDALIKRGAAQNTEDILAPISGIVTEKKVLQGKTVMEGDDLYTIADLGRVWLQAKVFESEMQDLAAGTAVEVTTTAYPNETFAGRITFIAFSLEAETRTIAARVEVDNPDYHLKPGMYASALIRLPVGKIIELDPGKLATTQPAPLPNDLDPRPLVQAYLAVTGILAQDKTDATAAGKVEQEAQALVSEAPQQSDLVALGNATHGFAAKSLDDQRAALQPITAALVNILHAVPTPGLSLYVAHCPMAKADWITASRDIVNPYKGADMLTCGSITGAITPSAATQASALSHSERWARGYYCPVTPDRLYDQAAHCPADKALTKYVQIEKSLAVPESAVINTGTRQIVYRETVPSSGTFDMLEVKLGPRASSDGAEYYPVISGLQADDLIATQGTFLVDAENRLNPGASVQFLGATPAESAKHQH